MNKGFNLKYYSYPLHDRQMYDNTNFLASGYLTRPLISSASKVLSASLSITNVPLDGDRTMNLYGMNVAYTHFLFEYTGYLIVKVTGLYQLSLDQVDDSAMIWVGQGAFDCCHPDTKENGVPSNAADTPVISAMKTLGSSASSKKSTIYLEHGYYIPMRIVYVNIERGSTFGITLYDPNNKQSDLNIVAAPGDLTASQCKPTTIDLPSVITTHSGTDSIVKTVNLVTTFPNGVITTRKEVIIPFSTTTIYNTNGILSTTVVPTTYSDGNIGSQIIVYTPWPTSTMTSGTVPTTFLSTITNASGSTKVVEVVVTPWPTSTMTSGTVPTTFLFTITNASGSTKVVEVVVTPWPVSTLTSGTVPTTILSTITDKNGSTKVVEVVVTPWPTSTMTSGTVPTTFLSTITNASGSTKVVEVVVTPWPTSTMTSGTIPTTFLSTITKANGSTEVIDLIVVPTHSSTSVNPTISITTKTTTITSGTGTSISSQTTTFGGDDDKTVEIIIFEPYPFATVTSGTATGVYTTLIKTQIQGSTGVEQLVVIPTTNTAPKSGMNSFPLTPSTTSTVIIEPSVIISSSTTTPSENIAKTITTVTYLTTQTCIITTTIDNQVRLVTVTDITTVTDIVPCFSENSSESAFETSEPVVPTYPTETFLTPQTSTSTNKPVQQTLIPLETTKTPYVTLTSISSSTTSTVSNSSSENPHVIQYDGSSHSLKSNLSSLLTFFVIVFTISF